MTSIFERAWRGFVRRLRMLWNNAKLAVSLRDPGWLTVTNGPLMPSPVRQRLMRVDVDFQSSTSPDDDFLSVEFMKQDISRVHRLYNLNCRMFQY